MKRKDITGIILCGGKSSRMLTNKALLKLGDKTVIEVIVEKMCNRFNDILLSANNPSDYTFLKLPIVSDIFVNRGPLAGIHSALTRSTNEKNFIISCDTPLISEDVINYLINYKSNKDIILPKNEFRIQHLCGIFSKSILPVIEKVFRESGIDKNIKGSVHELLDRVSTEILDIKTLKFYNKNIFLNMNTPEDYELIKKFARRSENDL